MNTIKKMAIGTALFFLSVTPAYAASLTLTSDKTTVKPGEQVMVTVFLSGNEPTFGTDVIVNYDPQLLTVQQITPTSLYPSYQPEEIMNILQTPGIITLSGSSSLESPVPAEGIFATISFTAQKTGTLKIGFQFDQSSTTKSGVIGSDGTELLTTVSEPLNITIKENTPNLFFAGVGIVIIILIAGLYRVIKKVKKTMLDSREINTLS